MSNASRDNADRESLVDQFQNVTGTSNESAIAILEACNWNLELAINMHVDGIQSNDVVELPTNSYSNNANSSVSHSADDSDYIRAPIPPVRQVLVEDDFTPTVSTRRTQNNVFDSFRDFQSEAKWQEQMQATSSSSNGESSSTNFTKSKKQTLFDLFRPPLDIMFRGNLEGCKEEGTKLNKWLLVNVQNFKEFSCQVLNRDVWSNSAVKEIIKEHFIFWQICMENNDGQRYIQFYNVHEYPHISILDPRTGEKIRTLNASNVDTFCESLIEFISEHPSPSGNVPVKEKVECSAQKSSFDTQKIYNQSEAAQIEAAIAASLQEIKNENKISENEIDSDIEIDNNDRIEEDSNLENWKDYLGPDDGKEAKILFRFPDGTKEQISFPASSQLKALFLYISSKSYNLDKFDLVMNFPSRNLNDLKPSETLIQAGLYPSTILYVQQKS